MGLASMTSRRVSTPEAFLAEAEKDNSIKYKARSGKTDRVYFAKMMLNDGTVGLVSVSAQIHNTNIGGKFKSCVCLKGVYDTVNGQVIHDGSCPYCDRVSSSWDEFNILKAQEFAKINPTLTGAARADAEKEITKTLFESFKVAAAEENLYTVVAVFKKTDDNKVVIGGDGLPEYDLKVMKLSPKRLLKLQTQLAGIGKGVAGSELQFNYPNLRNIAYVVGKSEIVVVTGTGSLTDSYPGLADKIDREAAAVNLVEALDSFPEFADIATASINITLNEAFKALDTYKANGSVGPYLSAVNPTPQITGAVQAPIPQVQGMPMPQGMVMPQGVPQGVPQGFTQQVPPVVQPQVQVQVQAPVAQPQVQGVVQSEVQPVVQPQGSEQGVNIMNAQDLFSQMGQM